MVSTLFLRVLSDAVWILSWCLNAATLVGSLIVRRTQGVVKMIVVNDANVI
jgi:hypothetical protein